MKDRTKLALRTVIGVLLVLTAAAYVFASARLPGSNIGIPVVAAVLVGIALWVLWKAGREAGEVRRGLKLEDERTRRLWEKASASTFVLSIWYILALSWYSSLFVDKFGCPQFRDPSQALAAAILGMTVIFFTAYAYDSLKGEL